MAHYGLVCFVWSPCTHLTPGPSGRGEEGEGEEEEEERKRERCCAAAGLKMTSRSPQEGPRANALMTKISFISKLVYVRVPGRMLFIPGLHINANGF